MSSAALCVDDSFWDTLTIEMREQIDQVEVLKQERAILAGSLRLVRVWLRGTIAGGVGGLL